MAHKNLTEEEIFLKIKDKKCIKCNIHLSLDLNDKGYIRISSIIYSVYTCRICSDTNRLESLSKERKEWTWAQKLRTTSGKSKKKNGSRRIISVDFLEKLAKKQNFKDPFLGIFNIDFENNKNPNYVSLDRIDNSKGYTEDNVQLVPRWQNYARNSCTAKEFKKLLLQIKETFEKNK
jgi:hypothetical protein